MRNAFVCCTPYHVMISIHMAQTTYKEYDNDIYISDHFKGAYEIYERIKGLKLFNESFFVKDRSISYDTSKFKYKKIVKIFKLDLKTVIERTPPLDYNQISVFCFSYFSTVFINKVKAINYDVKVSMMEDGLGSYLINTQNIKEKVRGLFGQIFKVFNKNFFNFTQVSELYLFKPQYFVGNINSSIQQIPNLTKNTNLIRVLNKVFNYQEQDLINNYDVLYFDQTFSMDNISGVKEDELLLNVLNVVKNDKMLIKLHPRDDLRKYEQIGVSTELVYQSSYPWELIYLNELPKDKVLISINSTAVLTPHLIFNENHQIVLLYKIAGVQNKEIEKFVNTICKVNEDLPVFIPHTINELSQRLSIVK